jgi:hypothetical protein
MLPLLPLDEENAREMLLLQSQCRRKTSDDEDAARQIVQKLGLIPLACKQCAADVAESRESLEDYCLPFEELMARINVPEEKPHLQSAEDRDTSYDLHTKKTILTTWELSFQHLSKSNPDAADLLCTLGFLDGDDISEALLVAGLKPQRRWDNEGNASISFVEGTPDFIRQLAAMRGGRGVESGLKDLVSRSLLFRKRRKGCLFLHPVVVLHV